MSTRLQGPVGVVLRKRVVLRKLGSCIKLGSCTQNTACPLFGGNFMAGNVFNLDLLVPDLFRHSLNLISFFLSK
jgi:hypothetical protein